MILGLTAPSAPLIARMSVSKPIVIIRVLLSLKFPLKASEFMGPSMRDSLHALCPKLREVCDDVAPIATCG